MNFLENKFSKIALSVVSTVIVFGMLQGCGGTSSNECCQDVKLSEKIKETETVTAVPEIKGDEVVYVDRNVTVIEYVDRNVTVDVIKVRPEARISGLVDGAILTGDILEIDSVESSDVDGNVTHYRWILDDANISTEKSPTIALPTEEGTHTLCLEVVDNDSLSSTEVCKTFTIPPVNQDPMAVMSGLNVEGKLIKTQCPVTVSGINSIAEDSEITTYVWTIDDNITLNGQDQNLSFETLGEHKVCLSVTDSNELNNTQCSTIVVNDHVSPTPVLTIRDSDNVVITSDDLLVRAARYDFTCAGSTDDCGNEEPMTCEWNAHSYRIVDEQRVDYISDCLDHNSAPSEGQESWIQLCGSPASAYTYIEIALKITDQFGKSTTETQIFEVAP